MMRLLFVAVAMVLWVTGAQAVGSADLKAAQAAAEKGTGDEAIQFFTQALAAGDLSADDQLTAHKGRGREYSAKSLIADAFNRQDDGKRLRDNAIADFSAVLSAKPDDVAILIERGQDYHMSQQFDPAIADFSEAVSREEHSSLRNDTMLADYYYSRGIAERGNANDAAGNADIQHAKTLNPEVADRFPGFHD